MTGMRRLWRADERGAGSVEYAGILLVVGSLVAAAVVSPASDVVAPRVAHAICQAFEKLPGGGLGCVSPGDPSADSRVPDFDDCVVRRTDRTDSANLQIKIVRGEVGSGDSIRHNGDGSAAVSLHEARGIGVATPTKGNKLGTASRNNSSVSGDVTAYLQASGELEYTYDFPADLGGPEAAQQFLDDRRGLGDRVVDAAIPGAQTLKEGGSRLGNSISSNIEDGVRSLVGAELSDEERAHRARVDGLSEADSVSAAVSVQGLVGASGDVSYRDRSVADGSVELSGSVTGRVTADLVPGEGDSANAFAGELRYDLSGELRTGLQGRDGQELVGLPPFLNISGSTGQTWTYEVAYDGDGEPTTLKLVGEQRSSLGGGLKPTVGRGEGGGSYEQGTLTQEVRVLDLADPTNRALFDEVFWTQSLQVGDHAAAMSVPQLVSQYQVPEFVGNAAALWQRTDEDAVFYTFEYDFDGLGLAGRYTDEKAVGARIAAAGLSNTDQTLTLTSATGRDARTGEPATNLASCGQ